MKCFIYLLCLFTLQLNAQTYIPINGKWNAGVKNDYTGVWKTSNSVSFALLDGTGSSSNNAITANLGLPGDLPIALDINGDGRDEIAVFRPSTSQMTFYSDIYSGIVNNTLTVGISGDQPLRWRGTKGSNDGFALYRPSTRQIFFYSTNNSTTPFHTYTYGNTGDVVLTGDWDGDGLDGVALYRPSTRTFWLYQNISDQNAYLSVTLGNPGDIPISGDWNGDGIDGVGLFRKITPSNYQFWFWDPLGANPTASTSWNDQSFYNMTAGRQIFYTTKVPHTDIDGNLLTSYNPTSSFFPKGLYNVTPNDIPTIYNAGFNLGFIWPESDYPLTTSALSALDATQNKFKTIVYFSEPGGMPFTGKFNPANTKNDVIGIRSFDNCCMVSVDVNGDNIPDNQFKVGNPGDIIFSGKWANTPGDGDGYALYRPSNGQVWFYKDINNTDNTDISNNLTAFYSASPIGASSSDLPLSGWWSTNTPGFALYNPGTGSLRFYNLTNSTLVQTVYIGSGNLNPGGYANPSYEVITGDWGGHGVDGFALYSPSTGTFWFYDSISSTVPSSSCVIAGAQPDEIPMSGDWNGDGRDEIGLYLATTQKKTHVFWEYTITGSLLSNTPVNGYRFTNPLLQLNPPKYTYGFYTYDEPSGQVPPLQLQSIYSAYANTSSQVLFHVDVNSVPKSDSRYSDWQSFANMGGATAHDDYPVTVQSYNMVSVSSIANTISQARLASNENLPNWYVAPAFKQINGANQLSFYLPSPTQLSSMVYTAIVHGATGIFDFSYQNSNALNGTKVVGISPTSPTPYLTLWQQATSINQQIDFLAPFILSNTPIQSPSNTYSVFTTATPNTGEANPIRTLYKLNTNGDCIIIAVNMTNQPLTAIINLPFSISPKDRIVQKLFEGSNNSNVTIQTFAGAINDGFAAFQVHVYMIPVNNQSHLHKLITTPPNIQNIEFPTANQITAQGLKVSPNPSNADFAFEIPANTGGNLFIYDMQGHPVKQFLPIIAQTSSHMLMWNGKDNANKTVAKGMYLYVFIDDKTNLKITGKVIVF